MWSTPADPSSGIGKDLHGLTDQTGGRAHCQSGWPNQGRSWNTKHPPVQQCNQFYQTSPVEISASRLLAKMCGFQPSCRVVPQNQIHMNGHVKLSLGYFSGAGWVFTAISAIQRGKKRNKDREWWSQCSNVSGCQLLQLFIKQVDRHHFVNHICSLCVKFWQFSQYFKHFYYWYINDITHFIQYSVTVTYIPWKTKLHNSLYFTGTWIHNILRVYLLFFLS